MGVDNKIQPTPNEARKFIYIAAQLIDLERGNRQLTGLAGPASNRIPILFTLPSYASRKCLYKSAERKSFGYLLNIPETTN